MSLKVEKWVVRKRYKGEEGKGRGSGGSAEIKRKRDEEPLTRQASVHKWISSPVWPHVPIYENNKASQPLASTTTTQSQTTTTTTRSLCSFSPPSLSSSLFRSPP